AVIAFALSVPATSFARPFQEIACEGEILYKAKDNKWVNVPINTRFLPVWKDGQLMNSVFYRDNKVFLRTFWGRSGEQGQAKALFTIEAFYVDEVAEWQFAKARATGTSVTEVQLIYSLPSNAMIQSLPAPFPEINVTCRLPTN